MAIDESLLGKYDKDDSKIRRAVYRIKNSNDDGYTRIHFETSSQMIHDATSKATANKVARRDTTGSIEFTNIKASGLTATNTLEVASTSSLKGATTIGASVADNAVALAVPSNKNTTLGGTLSVAGTSTFTGKTNSLNGADIANGLKITSGGADIIGNVTARTNASVLGDFSVSGNTTLGTVDNSKTTTIHGTAKINKLEVTDENPVTNLNADRVDSCHVSDTSATKSNLWTAEKVNTTKADKTVTITASDGLNGNGTLAGNISIKHNTKSVSQTPAETKSFTTLKSMTFDSYGHVNSCVETDLDQRYFTQDLTIQQIENRINNVIGNDVILKNPSNGNVNGSNLKMEGFTMQFNKGTNSIDFVFV